MNDMKLVINAGSNQNAVAAKLSVRLRSKKSLQWFSDVQQLVTKANDDLVTLIKFRISEHQKAEQAKAVARDAQQLLGRRLVLCPKYSRTGVRILVDQAVDPVGEALERPG